MDCPPPPLHLCRFAHRPEWLCEGARLIIRDRNDGHISGTGFVRRLLLRAGTGGGHSETPLRFGGTG